jgi:glycosyltransferase involved in cell wall biosynthesis
MADNLGQPLFSIITICRNLERDIERTMVSVLEQSYSHIEYIIVDGASKDKTLSVIREVAARYPTRQIIVISEPDKGIPDAMNKGVRSATGRIVLHLHGGDSLTDNTVIDRIAQSFVQEHWTWAVAGSIAVDAAGSAVYVYRPNPDYRVLLKKNFIPHQSTFLLREVFETYGLFRTDLKCASDYEYWLRIAILGSERFTVLPYNTTYYLDGGGSARLLFLLKHLRRIRRDLRNQGAPITVASDYIFFARVAAFWAYSRCRAVLVRLRRKVGGQPPRADTFHSPLSSKPCLVSSECVPPARSPDC